MNACLLTHLLGICLTLCFPLAWQDLILNIWVSISLKTSKDYMKIILLTKLKLDLQKWRILHLSLVGRVNCFKMTVLPRFLYLFQCFPIFLSKTFFNKLDKTISSFIWDGKIPRIHKEFLQKNRSNGGLALPNILYYYWAVNVQKIIYWMHSSGGTDWYETESKSCTATSLQALITFGLPIKIAQHTSNPVVHFTLKI